MSMWDRDEVLQAHQIGAGKNGDAAESPPQDPALLLKSRLQEIETTAMLALALGGAAFALTVYLVVFRVQVVPDAT